MELLLVFGTSINDTETSRLDLYVVYADRQRAGLMANGDTSPLDTDWSGAHIHMYSTSYFWPICFGIYNTPSLIAHTWLPSLMGPALGEELSVLL